MTKAELISAIKNIKNGVFFKIKYSVSVPVKAEYKKNGIEVRKYVSTVARTGIKYGNIASVIEYKKNNPEQETKQRADNKEWMIDNKLFHNTNTNLDYMRLGTISGVNPSVVYRAYKNGDQEIALDKNFVIDSYWNGAKSPAVFDVKLSNIESIG